MKKELFFATNNRGKVNEVNKFLAPFRQNIVIPSDIGIRLGVKESGNTFEENAILKAKELLNKLDTDGIVVADDSGIEIDALNGEPGVHTRRWSGKDMTDDEILAYCLDRLKNVPPEKRTARFKTVLAVGSKTHAIKTFQGELEGVILEEPIGPTREGMPFAPVFYVPEWGMLLSDIYDMPSDQKRTYASHRVRAFQNAMPYILAQQEDSTDQDMKRKYKTILFDFDGTIADTKECIISSFQKSLAFFDLSLIDEDELVTTIGKPLVEQVRTLIPGSYSDIFYDSFVGKFREIYAEESKTKLAVFKGMKRVLSSMRRKKIVMAIVSSKKESVLQDNCRTLNIGNYFDLFVGPDSVKHHKPHPETVYVSMQRLGITDKASVLVIGDTTFDVEMGNSANVDTCAVTWGVHPKDQLLSSKPTYLVEKVADLNTFT